MVNVKTLVISDIHGNWPALKAVVGRSFDRVIVLGDLVGYGPFPAECVSWVRENADVVIQGNHDRAYGDDVPALSSASFRWLSDAMAPWTWGQLSDNDLSYLRSLPRWALSEIEGRQYAFVHAAPSSPLYEYIGPDVHRWKAEVRSITADVLAVGHTHLQFALPIDDRLVVNPGSVGQPKDGDPRAAFLVIEDGEIKLERVDYPIEKTIKGLADTGLDSSARSVLSILLRTGTTPQWAASEVRAELAGSDDHAPPRRRDSQHGTFDRDSAQAGLRGTVEDLGLAP